MSSVSPFTIVHADLATLRTIPGFLPKVSRTGIENRKFNYPAFTNSRVIIGCTRQLPALRCTVDRQSGLSGHALSDLKGRVIKRSTLEWLANYVGVHIDYPWFCVGKILSLVMFNIYTSWTRKYAPNGFLVACKAHTALVNCQSDTIHVTWVESYIVKPHASNK